MAENEKQNTDADTDEDAVQDELQQIVSGLDADEFAKVQGLVSDEVQKRSGAASEAELSRRLGSMTNDEYRQSVRDDYGFDPGV